jgi:hypothetical protein
MKVVASFLIENAGVPAACRAGKDRRQAQKIVKAVTSARKKLAKAASAEGARKRRLLDGVAAKLEQANARARKLEGTLSPACHAALTELATAGQGKASCLQ